MRSRLGLPTRLRGTASLVWPLRRSALLGRPLCRPARLPPYTSLFAVNRCQRYHQFDRLRSVISRVSLVKVEATDHLFVTIEAIC